MTILTLLTFYLRVKSRWRLSTTIFQTSSLLNRPIIITIAWLEKGGYLISAIQFKQETSHEGERNRSVNIVLFNIILQYFYSLIHCFEYQTKYNMDKPLISEKYREDDIIQAKLKNNKKWNKTVIFCLNWIPASFFLMH